MVVDAAAPNHDKFVVRAALSRETMQPALTITTWIPIVARLTHFPIAALRHPGAHGSVRKDLESIAEALRELAGLREDENELVTTTAIRLLGPDGVAIVPKLCGAAYLRRRIDGGYQIAVRPNVPDIRFAIAHELGHFALRTIVRSRLTPAEEERAANYLGAAILAPARSFRRAVRHYGKDLGALRPLAKTFGLSQTSAQLRIAEVLGVDRAVVTAGHAHVMARGPNWETACVIELADRIARRRSVLSGTMHGGIDDGRIAASPL